MTKDEWLSACAKRFEEKAEMHEEAAMSAARACWDSCLDAAGDEATTFVEYQPADAADEEMGA